MESRILAAALPPSRHVSCLAWPGGSFELGERRQTPQVDNTIAAREPILMATLRGGAKRLRQQTDDGQTYDGPDLAGSFSFLPAGCGRSLILEDVAWRWASITVATNCLDDDDRSVRAHFINNRCDAFIHALLIEMSRLYDEDKWIDPAYCETASIILAHYMARRHWRCGTARPLATGKLSKPQLRRLEAYVDAHIDEEIRIAALADVVGLSVGQFHRSFRASTGRTPLQFISRRRIEVACDLLRAPDATVLTTALSVGIASTSHFARLFRSVIGISPGRYRKAQAPK